MSRVNPDSVIGFAFENETVCRECATKEEWDGAMQDELITEDGKGEDIIFCDRCKKQI